MKTDTRIEAYEGVLNSFRDERERLHALAAAICQNLAPVDEGAPTAQEAAVLQTWRLAQILESMLESITLEVAARAVLIVNHAEGK